jgi:hypothetical protein
MPPPLTGRGQGEGFRSVCSPDQASYAGDTQIAASCNVSRRGKIWQHRRIEPEMVTSCADSGNVRRNMFSHVVIFWTDPKNPLGADELIAGANKYLKPIPGVLHYHVGRMAPSHRPVVDQTYQVALNLVFPDKKAQDDYQVHPLHLEFVDKVFKRVCTRVIVYDFA